MASSVIFVLNKIYIRLTICAIEIYIVNTEKVFNASSASLEMSNYSIYNQFFANHNKRVCLGQSADKFFIKKNSIKRDMAKDFVG